MIFLTIFIVPLIIAIAGFIFLKGITWKEFLLHLGIQTVIAVIGTLILMFSNISYREIWNGYIVKKQKEKVSCEHSYECNCYYTYDTDSNGNTTSTRHCMTCYEHDYDIDWVVYTNIGERIEINRIDRQGLKEPSRWTEVEINEPTSSIHSYKNYLRASKTTIYKQDNFQQLIEQYKNILPNYPDKIYDYYKIKRFLDPQKIFSSKEGWIYRYELAKINGTLGHKKQCNVIIIVTKEQSHTYFDALMTKWEEGNKNDIIIWVNLSGKNILNVKSKCLTNSDIINVKLQDDILAHKIFNKKVFDIIKDDINKYFVRKPMAEFEYLMKNLPIEWWQYLIFIGIGVIVSGILVYKFHKEDIFGDE